MLRQRGKCRGSGAARGSQRLASRLHPRVYDGVVGRTNIEIDDVLIERAMRIYRLRSKREVVDLALRRLVGQPLSLDEARAMEGSGWEGDLDELRGGDRTARL
jgi:Arc/MetJ family transcription regulator